MMAMEFIIYAGIVFVICFAACFLLTVTTLNGRCKIRYETTEWLRDVGMACVICMMFIVSISNFAEFIQKQITTDKPSIIDVVERPSNWDFLDD